MREYVICSYYLYDNQLETDYIILSDNGFLMYSPFNKIYSLKSQLGDTEEFKDKSIKLIVDACKFQTKYSKCLLIKNEGFMKNVLIKKTHNPLYNGYDIVWDEEKSGINPFEYKYFTIWNIGKSSGSMYRIQEHSSNRDFIIRDNILNSILDEV